MDTLQKQVIKEILREHRDIESSWDTEGAFLDTQFARLEGNAPDWDECENEAQYDHAHDEYDQFRTATEQHLVMMFAHAPVAIKHLMRLWLWAYQDCLGRLPHFDEIGNTIIESLSLFDAVLSFPCIETDEHREALAVAINELLSTRPG